MKTLNRLFRQERERLFVPRSAQAVIPIQTVWDDGIFLAGGKYTKTYRFDDINYDVASKEDQKAMFFAYCDLLNSFDSGATYKITIIVKRLDKEEFKRSILVPLKGDALDVYRKEYNKVLLEEATGANGFIQQKYITVSTHKKGIEEARNYFNRIGVELSAHFNRLGSRAVALDANEKLRLFYDFFRPGEENGFCYDAKDTMRKGHSYKDCICPSCFEFEKDHFRIRYR